MSAEKNSVMKVTGVTFEEFTGYEFMPPSTFFIRDATGDYKFFHTASRTKAQTFVDSAYGKGRYTVVASKLQKTKSKQEGGGYSCNGTATR